MCSLAAAVQGMDETANNGAQAIYREVSPSYRYSDIVACLDHY